MSAQATLRNIPRNARRIAAAALAGSAVIQDYDGLAAVLTGLKPAESGDSIGLVKEGVFEMPKAASIVLLAGGRAYWDRANAVVTFNKAVAGAFYLGTVHADAAASDLTVLIELNAVAFNRISAADIFATALVGSATATRDAFGARTVNAVIATNEAEKSDLLSVSAVAVADGPIFEARFTLVANGSDNTVDINIGLANATHASNADSITEAVFFHIDGGSLNINAQSVDGTTTVASTDTTVDAVVGTYNEFWIDARDPADVKLYIDGIRVLSATTFKLNAATGPLKALVHIEKTAGTATGSVATELLAVRSTDLL